MDHFLTDYRVDPEVELKQVLQYNQIEYLQEEDSVRFVFADSGRRWETLCRAAPQTVIVYGIYPLSVTDINLVQRMINSINAVLKQGGMFLSEDQIVLRTSADIFDAYSAHEAITRALEYNSSVMVRFWNSLAECCQQSCVFKNEDTNPIKKTQ